jgi:Putative transposase/Transposase zinc-binding domain
MAAPTGSAVAGRAEPRGVVGDILRRFGPAYLDDHAVSPQRVSALRAAMACRTATLGGHLDTCDACGWSRPSYNSCRDRHCSTCQSSQAARWLAGRIERVLPTHYFHVVFTLPSELRALALANPKALYGLLFDAAAETLDELARTRLHARLGVTAVLHTWTREMLFHPHLHCVVTGGGLSSDDTRWVSCADAFLFPVHVMGALFRGKFMDGLVDLYTRGRLCLVGACAPLANPNTFAQLRRRLYAEKWVVYAKRPFGGPEQVLAYLSRYTHRVAISDSRILRVDNDRVVIKTRDGRTCTIKPDEFVRRLLLHVLPSGFRKIRHYGLLAPANVGTRLLVAGRLLDAMPANPHRRPPPCEPESLLGESLPDAPHCPQCGASPLRQERLPPQRAPPDP